MTIFVPAARVSRIKISPTTAASARVRELKAAGRDIVDMAIGEPDFDTPDHVKAAAHEAIDRGETKYTAVNGTVALRKAIIADYKRRLGLEYADNEICVGGGAKQILFLALMASVEEGAEVIIPAPYWVSYPDMVIANDGKPVIVRCSENQGFKLTADALEAAITPKTRWLILNAPSNPTGAAYSRDDLKAIGDVLLRHPNVLVLSDDIYDQIWYRDEPADDACGGRARLEGPYSARKRRVEDLRHDRLADRLCRRVPRRWSPPSTSCSRRCRPVRRRSARPPPPMR